MLTVEDHEVSCDGNSRVDDDALARGKDLDGGLLDGRLVAQQGAKGRLDETGGPGEGEDRDDESTERRVRLGHHCRDGGNDEDDVRDGADGGTDADGFEPAPLGVRHNTTPNGHNVRQESEHLHDRRSGHGPFAERTRRLV